MTGFYDITTILKNQLILDPFVNTVTEGDIFEVDLGKQTIFPLSHIMVNQATREGHAIRFNVTIMCMDIVDKTKDETTDSFRGNDNEQDVLNTQLAVALRCVEVLDRGDLRESATLDGEVTFEPFTERFENYLAGWSATFDVLVRNTMTSCDSGASLITCPLANYIVEYQDGTPIESGTIASGATKTIIVPDCPACDSASWTLLDTDGNVLDSGTIPSGGSANITAPDSTYVVQYENGTPIESGNILSGGSVLVEVPNPITCADATVNINGSLWDTVPSGGTENISVRQSTGATEVGAIQGQYFRIADSNIQNSDGSYDIDVKAEDSLVLPDSQINVNGVYEVGEVVSVKTIDVNITDGTDPVTPTDISLVGNTLTVQVPAGGVTPVGATLMKTGQTTSYVAYDDGAQQMGRLTDFTTLNKLNPFGNYKRFTDKTDAGTFANSVAYDWSTYDVETGKVLAYYFGDANYRNLTNQCAQHVASTIDGLSNNWFLWNSTQCENILNKSLIQAFMLNYAPFNMSSRYFWISSNQIGNIGTCTDLAAAGWLITVSKNNTYLGIWVRECTVSGTTIS